MSHPALDEVQCPICLDTLKKPIRMLLCGHNLCQSCLVDLCKNVRQRSCPTCRQGIQLGTKGVEGLPRNHAVENMIEKLTVGVSQTTVSAFMQPESQKEIIGNLDLVKILMNDGKYKDASEILTLLINQNEAINKIPFMIKQLKCLQMLDQIEEAKHVCVELNSILGSCVDISIIREKCAGCDEDLKIAEKFLEKKECGIAIGLANSLFKLIKCLREGKNKLFMLKYIGLLMRDIAVEMSNQNRAAEFKPQLQTMHDILKEMQKISDVHVKTKCLQVIIFLKNFGSACNYVNEYPKSIEIHNQAIDEMLNVFGDEACKYQILGHCYKSVGLAYKRSNRPSDAKSCFSIAIDCFTSATDCSSEAHKQKMIAMCKISLNQ